MHKCKRNGSNTLNLWPLHHFAPNFEIDLQITWTSMFQMPLLRIKNDIFAKLFWNQNINIEVMACTNPDGHTHTHIFSHAHIFTRTYFHTHKHQTEVVITISRSPPAGATKRKRKNNNILHDFWICPTIPLQWPQKCNNWVICKLIKEFAAKKYFRLINKMCRLMCCYGNVNHNILITYNICDYHIHIYI